MRIPTLLIAALIALAPAVHAADAPPAPDTPPAAATAPPPAPAPAAENAVTVPAADNVEAPPPVPAHADAPAAAPAPADAPRTAPAPAPSAAPPTRSQVYLSMDFTDVELPVLIKFMSEQTKKNFIFDERVQGKITIISPRRVTLDEAYEVFLSVLQAKGFATITQGNTIKIVAAREARQDTIRTGVGRDTGSAEFITRLIPLQNLDSAEVVPLVTPLVSKDGMVSAFASSNTLLLIDSRANIDRIVKILDEVDSAGTPGILRVYPLAYAVAADAAKTLTSIYLEGAAAAAPSVRGRARGPQAGVSRGIAVKFLPDARTNSLIVFAGQEMQNEVADLLKKIDIPASSGSGKINVYYLENADAEEVSKVLASLSEKRAGAAGAPPAAVPGRAPVPATGGGVVSAELEGGVKVTPDKATNALIIVASANDYETLLGVIKKLDIRRRQVYVEAVIMEITLDKSRDLGAEFRGVAASGDRAVIGGTNFDFAGNVNQLFAALATGNPLIFGGTGLIAGGIAGTVTLPDGTEVPALTAVLRAAQRRDNINILSSPHLLTLDNKEAEIVVGENIPFVTSQSRDTLTPTNSGIINNTIERKDVGITLRLTPHIHESDFVSLDIYQESSAVKGESLLNSSTVGPTTTKRSAKTSVLVKNGDTVVLGGMMQETFTNTVSQIPFLGDIPLLGNLFRFKSVSRKKTNLLIMLTPQIIREPGEMLERSAEQRRKIIESFDLQKKDVERTFPDPKPRVNR